MIRSIIAVVALLLFAGCAPKIQEPQKPKKYYERDYQEVFCKTLKGKTEHVLQDRTRVDCLSDIYAVEIDFARKWAEGVGQSLYYAHMTGRMPAVGLIVDRNKDMRYLRRLYPLADKYHIKVFIIDKK